MAYNFVENKNGVECWTTLIWNELRPKKEKKEWNRLMWTSLYIPKHVIVSWMAVFNRLPTLDRMFVWGLEIDDKCRLCQDEWSLRSPLFRM